MSSSVHEVKLKFVQTLPNLSVSLENGELEKSPYACQHISFLCPTAHTLAAIPPAKFTVNKVREDATLMRLVLAPITTNPPGILDHAAKGVSRGGHYGQRTQGFEDNPKPQKHNNKSNLLNGEPEH
jgi:hypothetical protein